MEGTYIFEGKTTNEAIEKGLKELNVSKNKVEIKVLDSEEKRSFFSILTPRVVKVEMKLKEEHEAEQNHHNNIHKKEERKINLEEIDVEAINESTNKFMTEFINSLPTKEITYNVEIENENVFINIEGQDTGYLIGFRGEVLNSLQSIISNIVNKNAKQKMKIILNISGYREKRKKELENLAEKISYTVVKTRKSITLEPMTAYERKIIHSKLQDSSKVKTYSVGEEPYRKVVIALK